MKIDAHHHFWRYSEADYGWIGPGMEAIRRDFLPEHLRVETREAGIDGAVSVQARQSLEETRWLLEMADANDFIRGVVGWVPLAFPTIGETLETFSNRWKLRGVRHVVQDEPDPEFLLGARFNRGVALLREFGLVYDLLIFERQLPQAIRFVDLHPRQIFVLDHVAKPRIRDAALEPWRTHLRELARRPNVYCKLSGMVTEADCVTWTPDQLRPYAETVLEAFGPRRTMFGSDWPVCLLACGYRRWVETVAAWTAGLSPDERDRVWGGTAMEAYGLKR